MPRERDTEPCRWRPARRGREPHDQDKNPSTTKSYLYRLVVANQLHPDDLRAHLTGTRRHAPFTIDSLATVTGRAPHALLHALPEMRQPTQPGVEPKIPGHARRTVCRHCTARRDGFPFAVTWLPTEVNVCSHP